MSTKLSSIDLQKHKSVKILENYRDKCYVNNILCQKSCDYYSKIRSIVSLPLILVNSVLSILNSSDIEAMDMKFANVILNGSTALLLGLISNFKITEKSTHFKSMATKYIKLCHLIEDKLLYNTNSITKEIMNDIIKEYDGLNEGLEYSFPEHIKNMVKNQYRGTRTLPNILNCEGEFSNNNSPDFQSISIEESNQLPIMKAPESSILFTDNKPLNNTPRVIDFKKVVRIEGLDQSV